MKSLEYFERFARNLDRRAWNVDTAPWAAWAWSVVEREIGRAKGCFVVDLGTGTGAAIETLLRFTNGRRYLGVDFSPEMIRRAKAKQIGLERGVPVDFIVQRIDRLSLPEGTVDHFVSSGTFHHIKNKQRVIASLHGMLRPGGKFINIDQFLSGSRYVSETEAMRRRYPKETARNDRVRQSFQWLYDSDEGHPIEFRVDPYDFRDTMVNAGFEDVTVHVSLQPGYAVVSGRKPGDDRSGDSYHGKVER